MLAQTIVADLWEFANARHIDIGLIDAQDIAIFGHQEALNILIRNLLDNAIKYTPFGGTVNVAVQVIDAHIQLIVEDSGPGIPASDLERVLDRFYRVPGTPSGGSGLGLAIVKTISDLHSATLFMGQSTALGGLKVTIVFPDLSEG